MRALVTVLLMLLLTSCGVRLTWHDMGAPPEIGTELYWDEVLFPGDIFRVEAYVHDTYVSRLRVTLEGYELFDYRYFYEPYSVLEYARVPYYVHGDALVVIDAWDGEGNMASEYVRVYVVP